MPKGKHSKALFEVINQGKGDLKTPAWWYKQPAGSSTSTVPMRDRAERSNLIIAAVAGAVLVVLLPLVFLIARSHRPADSGKTTDELMAGPAQPNVMDIKHGEAGLTPAPDENTSPSQGHDVVQMPEGGKRTLGLNYVVVQSYPDEKSAIAAHDLLAKNGVQTTVEKGLRGWNTNWFTVVGTQGFSKMKTPVFEAYVQKINRVSDSFAKRGSFKAFKPLAYKWDR